MVDLSIVFCKRLPIVRYLLIHQAQEKCCSQPLWYTIYHELLKVVGWRAASNESSEEWNLLDLSQRRPTESA